MPDRHDPKFMSRLRQAFLDFGYEPPTMIVLARACDLTRRALYHHFSSKEEAFREVIRWRHEAEIEAGMAAGRRVVDARGTALSAVAAIFDARYGETRRDLERSPHALELNREAFRRCHDIMSASALEFQRRLAEFLSELESRGLLKLRAGVSGAETAQLLADGARGVNQTLPLRPTRDIAARYRRMCEALLYGCADMPPS